MSSTAWTTVSTALTDTTSYAAIQDFARGTDRYTILMNGTDKLYWDGSTSVPVSFSTSVPDTDIFTVHKGRVYAVRDNDIKYTALNDITDWTSANDAGTIDVTYARGPITAITEYNDHVICFTQFSMHMLYGDGPSDYDLINVEGRVGCVSNKSLAVCNKRLYWLWYDGVYQYSNGSVQKISLPVSEYIENMNTTYRSKAVAGAWNEYLYLAIPYGSTATTNNLLLVFDTDKDKWYVETGAYKGFVTIGNVIYGVDYDGSIKNIRTGNTDDGTAITWYHISKAFNDNSLNYKALQDIEMVYQTTGTLNLDYSTSADSTAFTSLAVSSDFETDGIKHRALILAHAMQDIEWYRLKLHGAGQATIDFVQRNVVVQEKAR